VASVANIKTPTVDEKKWHGLTELELERARNSIIFHDELLEGEEAEEFHQLQRERWEDTIRYEQEQENKKRRRG